jgi:hypothetical protein
LENTEIMDNRKVMKWLPIDRDENGFATEECLRKIEACYEKEIPVAIAYVSYGTDYDVITPSSDIQGWLADIHNSAKYTHYLPIPKAPEE